MDKIWQETLARISELELKVTNIENFIVPGVNDKEEPELASEPDQKPDQKL